MSQVMKQLYLVDGGSYKSLRVCHNLQNWREG